MTEHEHTCCRCVGPLLAELVRRENIRERWQGRNHVSPVPHLALVMGHAAPLFGPRTAEDLC